MSYLGSWKIDDYLTFCCNTHDPDTGVGTDASSVPTYRVYEDETATPILTGSTAKLDDANTVGFYSERIQLTAANGFEKGKCYTIYITATVDSDTGTMHHNFQIEAEVDANTVSATNVSANVAQISGDATAADNLELITEIANITSLTVDATGHLECDVVEIEGADPTDQINTAVDAALNTAIPGAPTAHSINQRIKALDELTEASGAGDLAAILGDTNELQTDDTPGAITGLNNISVVDITQRQIPDSVSADGSLPTIEQALYMITQFLYERTASGTTVTVKKVDGSTSLLTLILDDATNPTSITRAT